MNDKPILCPSTPCSPGALLLGVVSAEGRVEHLARPVVIDERFVQLSRKGGAPEQRFRFSSPCVEGRCAQWSGGRCGVVDDVLTQIGGAEEHVKLPACVIRPQCRWFQQSGARACVACPEVVTDTR